jgi:hypothetical protein
MTSKPQTMNKVPVRLARLFLLAWVISLSGCTLIERAVELPTQAARSIFFAGGMSKPVDPVALQNHLLQFADTFITSVTQTLDQLKKPDGSAINRYDQVKLKSRLTTDMIALVSGSNQIGNLVETLVYVESLRISIESTALPSAKNFNVLPLLIVLRQREDNLKEIVRDVLTPVRMAQLQAAIEDWRKNRPSTDFDLSTFASFSLVNEVIANTESKSAQSSNNVFALLDLDPLAGLDPAARELTETRLFGERALFLGKRMPQLMKYEMELLTMRTADTQEVQAMVANSTQLATAADRFSQTLAQFPGMIRSEREQWIRDFHSEQKGLLELTQQAEKVTNGSARTAEWAERAIQSFNRSLELINERPKKPDARPFDIREYTDAATRIEGMSQRMTTLLLELQSSVDGLDTKKFADLTDTVTAQTRQRSEAMVEYTYQKGLRFVFLVCLMASLTFLLTALIYTRLLRKK